MLRFMASQRVRNIRKIYFVRKHLTRGFLCAVLDLSGTLSTPFQGLRNPGISHYGDKNPLPFYEPCGKR